MIVVGLDLSLTGAGIAFIRDDEMVAAGEPRFEVNTFGHELKKDATLKHRGDRIRYVADQISGLIDGEMERPDLIAIEDMPYGATGAGTIDRAALWWTVVNRLLRWDLPVVQVNVSTLKIYATGKGTGVGKDEVMLAVARRYPDAPITNNNEADAFGLAAIAARLVGQPIETLPLTHLRAMDKLVLPT